MVKKLILAIIICFLILSTFNIITTTSQNLGRYSLNTSKSQISENEEYWAILISVGFGNTNKYYDNSAERNIEYMYKTLLTSDFWQEDHIKVLNGKNTTLFHIIKALRWLDHMDDSNDFSLIYYSGHGNYLHHKNEKLGFDIPIDLPPFDEKDGCDEIIMTRDYQKRLFSFMTDDLLNFLLDRLDSKGTVVLFDSCYSGGMSDSNVKHKNDRVTLMSCRENEQAGGSWWRLFGSYLSEGLQGYADKNKDGFVSAEEAFYYASPMYPPICYCVPQIDDKYPGELILTKVNLPPNMPILDCNTKVGKNDEVLNFSARSIDPENNSILYGWNWQKDRIHDWHNLWGENVEEWSTYHDSGRVCNMSHSWSEPGVYKVRVKARDERGVELIPDDNDSGLWTEPLYILIHSQGEIVDQYQLVCINSTYDIDMDCTNYSGGILVNHENSLNINQSLAQSFTPTKNTLSKIKIKFTPHCSNDMYIDQKERYPVNMSIRETLGGEDLVTISKKLSKELIVPDSLFDFIPGPMANLDYTFYNRWVEFNFTDFNITPGNKYYIVLSCKSPNYLYGWNRINNNIYENGEAYHTNDSQSWLCNLDCDMCFITYE